MKVAKRRWEKRGDIPRGGEYGVYYIEIFMLICWSVGSKISRKGAVGLIMEIGPIKYTPGSSKSIQIRIERKIFI
jgi:hypothetical protein